MVEIEPCRPNSHAEGSGVSEATFDSAGNCSFAKLVAY